MEGDGRERHVLRLDRHMFLGLERLVEGLPNNDGPASCGR